MRRFFKWITLLNKRLYKKASFIVILALIVAMVVGFSVFSQRESGFLNILLVNQNKNDEISNGIVNELLNENSMILFKEASTPKQAIEEVKSGKVDAAWIFSKNTKKDLKDFSDNISDNSIITVIEREQNVALRLSHEKLTSKLYRYISKFYYVSYVRDKLPKLDNLSDTELYEFFDNTNISDELFVFSDTKGNITENKINYLTAPLRGILSVIIALCGMAGVLYYIQDKKRKTFELIPESRRFYLAFVSVFTAVINVAAVCFIALTVTGMSTAVLKEIICIIVFSLAVSSFCLLLYSVFPKINLYASLIPVLTVAMISICPVFFGLPSFREISHIFPVTYYLRATYDTRYIWFMLIYAAGCFMTARIITRFNKKI